MVVAPRSSDSPRWCHRCRDQAFLRKDIRKIVTFSAIYLFLESAFEGNSRARKGVFAVTRTESVGFSWIKFLSLG